METRDLIELYVAAMPHCLSRLGAWSYSKIYYISMILLGGGVTLIVHHLGQPSLRVRVVVLGGTKTTEMSISQGIDPQWPGILKLKPLPLSNNLVSPDEKSFFKTFSSWGTTPYGGAENEKRGK